MMMMRRTLLKGIGASGVLTAALAAGVLKPTQAYAADWNKAAFEAKDFAGALNGIGAANAADSKDIVLTAPEIAENGAVVPVTVLSNIRTRFPSPSCPSRIPCPCWRRSISPMAPCRKSRRASVWPRPPMSAPWSRLPTASSSARRKTSRSRPAVVAADPCKPSSR